MYDQLPWHNGQDNGLTPGVGLNPRELLGHQERHQVKAAPLLIKSCSLHATTSESSTAEVHYVQTCIT